MIVGSLFIEGEQAPLVEKVMRTTNPFERMRGLLGRPSPGAGEGLLITPCGSIHMFFMKYPIDAVFLDGELRVKRVVANLKPWRLASSAGSAMVLEMGAGISAEAGIVASMKLVWREC